MNEYHLSFYTKKLNDILSQRKALNKKYSLRAFGRDLGIHPSTLSQILLGKRKIPKTSFTHVLSNLKLNAREREQFKLSHQSTIAYVDDSSKVEERTRETFYLEDSFYSIIAHWEYFAILSLLETKNFKFVAEEVADRFEISIPRVQEVMRDLLQVGLIKRDVRRGYKRNVPHIKAQKDTDSHALKDSHRNILNLAIRKLDTTTVDKRYYCSLTIPMDPKKRESVIKAVSRFQTELKELYEDFDSNSIYNISIQLFPLTAN